VAALLLVVLTACPAGAQASADASATTPGGLVLTSQTAWVSTATGGDFRMAFSYPGTPPAGAKVAVTVYQRLTSRSDFDESVRGHIFVGVRHSDVRQLSMLPIQADGSVVADLPVNPTTVASSGDDFVRLSSPGVYPVDVRLLDRSGVTVARMVSHLLYTGGVSAPRLDVAWVIPFTAAPEVGPAGQSASLAAASTKPLSALAAALAAHPKVPVTVAPTGQTLDALSGSSAASQATVSLLAGVATRPGTQVVATPYVQLDVPAELAAGLDSELTAELTQGARTVATTLRVQSDSRTWVAQGSLDQASVDDLAARGVDHLVVDNSALAPLPSDLRSTTLARPFAIQARDGNQVTAVSGDPGLAGHFVGQGDQVLAAHQLLADLAMIQAERPADTRGVAMLAPAGWQPDPTFLRIVLDGLESSPVLEPVSVGGLMVGVPPAQEHRSPLLRAMAAQAPATAAPQGAAVHSARRRLNALASMLPAGSAVPGDAERALLVSQSVDLDDKARAGLLAVVNGVVDDQTRRIHLVGDTSITLTARQGRFPVTIVNGAAFQPRVVVRLSSQKLEFRPIDEPGAVCSVAGTAETCALDLRAADTVLKVPVVARTSGVFSLTIRLTSPDGGLVLATNQDTMRSTAASGVGIFLSIGAALLLAVWWARDLRHGRRARDLVPPDEGDRAADDTSDDGADDTSDDGADLPLASPVLSAPVPVEPVASGQPGAWDVVDRRDGPAAQPASAVPTGGRSQAHVATLPQGPVGGPGDDRVSPSSWYEWQPDNGDRPTAEPTPPPPVEPGGGDHGRGPARAAPRPPADNGDASFSRNTAIVAGGTLASRLTGFVRVLALVYAFRLTRLADIYNLANTAPNILYDLVLGGVLSATLVPVFVDWLGRGDEEGWHAVSAVVTVITAALAVLSAVFWLIAPVIIRLYLVLDHSPGGVDQRVLGTSLLRLFAPQLFLLGGIALTTALLNARRHFLAPAFSPVVNNVVVIVAIVAARLVAGSLQLSAFRRNTLAVLILGLGTTAGYLAQLVAQLPPFFRGTVRLRPVWDLRHPAVRTVLRLSLWTFGSVIASQISLNLVLIIAARRTGDVTAFQTAFQFFQLPYAIFAVSIAAVLTPDLSHRWATGDVAGFRRQLADGLRLTLAVVVPGAVGYMLLARPAITLVVHHGGVGASSARLIGNVLVLFAVGLPGFSAFLLLMRAYQAMQDTRSMFWLYLFENGLTVVLALALYPALGVGGLALGWVSAYTVGAVVAFMHLRVRTGGLETQRVVRSLVRVGVASAIMAVAVAVILKADGGPSHWLPLRVALATVGGLLVYLLAGRAVGITELRRVGDLGRRA
jgi:putative peptidoglycan lipid II flippase